MIHRRQAFNLPMRFAEWYLDLDKELSLDPVLVSRFERVIQDPALFSAYMEALKVRRRRRLRNYTYSLFPTLVTMLAAYALVPFSNSSTWWLWLLANTFAVLFILSFVVTLVWMTKQRHYTRDRLGVSHKCLRVNWALSKVHLDPMSARQRSAAARAMYKVAIADIPRITHQFAINKGRRLYTRASRRHTQALSNAIISRIEDLVAPGLGKIEQLEDDLCRVAVRVWLGYEDQVLDIVKPDSITNIRRSRTFGLITAVQGALGQGFTAAVQTVAPLAALVLLFRLGFPDIRK